MRESVCEVVKDSINVDVEESIIPLKRGYLTSITMQSHSTTCAFLLFNKPFLRTMCAYFLDDKSPSKESLEDMARELANLVVGHAKVIAQGYNMNFTISTPSFLGIKVLRDYDMGLHFRLRSAGHCSIFLRAQS